MESHSGYKTITPTEISNLIHAWQEDRIVAADARVYFACFELVAIREAASRYRIKRHERSRESCRYRLEELVALTRASVNQVKRSLERLAKARLISFSEHEIIIWKTALFGSEIQLEALSGGRSARRPIPVPRAVLRFLAVNRRAALTKVMLGYVLRGLSLSPRGAVVEGKGRAKASWLAAHFALSERAVRYAQAELRELGWIGKDSLSHQRVLNRHGAFFTINFAWSGKSAHTRRKLVKRDKSVTEIAPPPSQNCAHLAPPIDNKKTSYGRFNNQKALNTEPRGAGVYGKESNQAGQPNLRQIVFQDLNQLKRLEALYFQAVTAGWLVPSEAMALNFIAAAVRSREAKGDAIRIFVGIIRRGLWQHITQAQEDKARRVLARCRELRPDAFHLLKG